MPKNKKWTLLEDILVLDTLLEDLPHGLHADIEPLLDLLRKPHCLTLAFGRSERAIKARRRELIRRLRGIE